jgi:ribonuclease P protein component
MLPRSRRVSTNLFGNIIKKGATYHTAHFYLKAVHSGAATPSRFSIVVPKKIEKTAVKRNLIKRKSSAVLRKILSNIPQGYTGVFFAKKDSAVLSPQEYERELRILSSKLK